MKKLVVLLVVLFACASVSFAGEGKAGAAKGEAKVDVKAEGTLVSIDKEKKEVVVEVGKKKKAEKKTFVVDAKVLESLKEVKEGARVVITLKEEKVVSIVVAAEKGKGKKEEKSK